MSIPMPISKIEIIGTSYCESKYLQIYDSNGIVIPMTNAKLNNTSNYTRGTFTVKDITNNTIVSNASNSSSYNVMNLFTNTTDCYIHSYTVTVTFGKPIMLGKISIRSQAGGNRVGYMTFKAHSSLVKGYIESKKFSLVKSDDSNTYTNCVLEFNPPVTALGVKKLGTSEQERIYYLRIAGTR